MGDLHSVMAGKGAGEGGGTTFDKWAPETPFVQVSTLLTEGGVNPPGYFYTVKVKLNALCQQF